MAGTTTGYIRNVRNNDEECNFNDVEESPKAPSAIINKTTKDLYSKLEAKLRFQRKISWASLCTAAIAIVALFIYIGVNTVSQSKINKELRELQENLKTKNDAREKSFNRKISNLDISGDGDCSSCSLRIVLGYNSRLPNIYVSE